jgi:hypothetical protein
VEAEAEAEADSTWRLRFGRAFRPRIGSRGGGMATMGAAIKGTGQKGFGERAISDVLSLTRLVSKSASCDSRPSAKGRLGFVPDTVGNRRTQHSPRAQGISYPDHQRSATATGDQSKGQGIDLRAVMGKRQGRMEA